MIEHQFDTSRVRDGAASSRSGDRTEGFEEFEAFDYSGLVDEFRCCSTEWVWAERERVVRAQRALRVRELALTRVLDERGQVDDTLAGADGVTVRDVRRACRTARQLEAQPEVAKAAAAGRLSGEQLDRVSDLVDPADPASDRRWATEGPRWSPEALAHELRCRRTPTPADAAARRAARCLRFWDRADAGMVALAGELPDIDGVFVRTTFEHLIERMRPAQGEPWDTRERRMADALVELCRNYAHVQAETGPAPHFVVQVPMRGPAIVAGIPLPDQMVERLRAEARIEPVLVDGDGEPVVVGRTEMVLSDKTRRVIRQRDGKCRWPGCDRRHGLEIHHLWPRSWGGTDTYANLATVCAAHHHQLAPHGDLLLLGNPNHPAGLSLVHRDDLPALAQLAAEQARAGPNAN
jgi:hypothetical protein